MTPRVSVVIPVYNEGDGIVTCLDRLVDAITLPFEILVVFDTPDDTTRAYAEKYAEVDPRIVPTLNTYGRGPAFAIRYGIDHATAPVVVVTHGRRLRRPDPGRRARPPDRAGHGRGGRQPLHARRRPDRRAVPEVDASRAGPV